MKNEQTYKTYKPYYTIQKESEVLVHRILRLSPALQEAFKNRSIKANKPFNDLFRIVLENSVLKEYNPKMSTITPDSFIGDVAVRVGLSAKLNKAFNDLARERDLNWNHFARLVMRRYMTYTK